VADIDADLTLPLIVAGRDFADEMVDRLGDFAGRSIIVDATGLSSGTSSFAAELVRRVLVDGRATELAIVGPPVQFAEYARHAAADAGVTSALDIT
jgi:uncharacterized Fe-S center protein